MQYQAILQNKRRCGKLKRKRIIYAVLFLSVFLTEVIIALFIKDNFVRPYIGDLLVTVLLCAFCRIFIPEKISALPILVFVFSVMVEILQYIDIVKILGFENNSILSVLIGRSFSFVDIIYYAIGCLTFFILDKFFINKRNS